MHWHTWEPHPCITPVLPRLCLEEELKERAEVVTAEWDIEQMFQLCHHTPIKQMTRGRRGRGGSGNGSPDFCEFKQISECRVCACCVHTQVVVLGDSCGSSGSGPLLGEVVAKFHYALVLFQHFSNLHFYGSTQLLSLQYAQIDTVH